MKWKLKLGGDVWKKIIILGFSSGMILLWCIILNGINKMVSHGEAITNAFIADLISISTICIFLFILAFACIDDKTEI